MEQHGYLSKLGKALRNPRLAIHVLQSLVRGKFFLIACRLRGKRVEGGQGLRINGKLSFRGPGRLILGRNILISMHVMPFTYNHDSFISIGDETFLNGTCFGCAQEISIGCQCILADARIMDTDFHSLHADRHNPESPVRVKPVKISDNVWIGAQAGILPGTRIGKNSVVSFGAVCSGRYRADAVIVGNPAEVATSIPGQTA